MDISTAFLQSTWFSRDIQVIPPKEAKRSERTMEATVDSIVRSDSFASFGGITDADCNGRHHTYWLTSVGYGTGVVTTDLWIITSHEIDIWTHSTLQTFAKQPSFSYCGASVKICLHRKWGGVKLIRDIPTILPPRRNARSPKVPWDWWGVITVL